MSNKTGGPTLYGGQAVIEGVMMRGPETFAVACRQASGKIALTCEPVPKSLRPAWQKLPLLRGAFSLVDAMALGTRALFWAARIAEADASSASAKATVREAEESIGPALGSAVAGRDPEPIIEEKSPGSSKVTDVALGSAMAMGLLFGLVLVILIPNLILRFVQLHLTSVWWQMGLIDACVRFSIFFGYIGLVSRMAHVRRVFQYHGAEHKSINAWEAEGHAGLNVDSARAASRLHPRCGTSFVVIVLLLSTLALIPFYGLPAFERVPIHLLLTFPVAGISFELLRLAGKYRANPVAAALSRPGMWTQLLTTREPDDSQLECAIESLKAVMSAEDRDPLRANRPDEAEQEAAAAVA
jgi:uncharacterized protein YqhQ